MSVELQPILNFLGGVGMIVLGWLITQSQRHDQRIQKIEDVQGNNIDGLKKDVEKLEVKVEILSSKISDLATKIHAEKGAQNNLAEAIMHLTERLNNKN